MIKYAMISNPETGLCSVGEGTNEKFYQSIGMQKLDVVYSEADGAWYLAEMANSEDFKFRNAKYQKFKQSEEIKRKLNELDLKSIRAIRAGEVDMLAEYENQAIGLREQLNNL